MKVHNLVVTGSLTSGGENISTISSSVSTTVTELSSSLTSSIGSLSSSMVTMIGSMSSSITSSIGSMSSSMSSRFDTLESTTGSINTFTSSANNKFNSVESTTSSLNTFTSSASGRLNSVEGKTGSYATTGSNTFVGTQTIQGSIVPSAHATYDLGSAGYNFRHLYLSSASLYIDGTKVLGSTAQELQITTDAGQSFKILEAGSDTITLQSADGNITLATSGGGDVILDPTSGVIALKGTTTIYAGNRVLSSDGNAIQFGNSVTMTGSLIVTGYIETQELRTTYISSSILYRSGSTKFGDELTDTHAFSGSVSISGSLSVPGSGLVSGSSQILNGTTIHSGSFFNGISVVSGSSQITYSGLSGVPSGIISGSAQVVSSLPSGTVSGSLQIDLTATTNYSSGIKTRLNAEGVLSGSAQVSFGSITGVPSGLVSGSSQLSSAFLPLSGGTMSGAILLGSGVPIRDNAGEWILGKNSTTIQIGSTAITNGISFQSLADSTFTYRGNTIWHAGNFTPGNYVPLSGGTMTGALTAVGITSSSRLSVSGTNSSSEPLVNLTASGTGTFQRGVRLLNSGMNAGDHIMYAVGQADGARNMGQFYFQYNGAGSTSNRISMGLHSVDDVFNILGSGNVAIGKTSASSLLDVAGIITTSTNSLSGRINFGTDGDGIALFRDNTYDLVLQQNASSGNPVYIAGAGNVVISIDSNNNETDRAFIVGSNAVKSSNSLFSVNESGNGSFSGTLTTAGQIQITGADVDVRVNRGRFQVYNNAGTGNLGYRIRTDENGGWRWQFVDGGNNEYFGVAYPSGNCSVAGTLTVASTLTTSGIFNLPNNALISVNSEPDTWGARFRTTTSTTNLGASLKNIIWCGGGTNEGFAVTGVGTGTSAFEVRNDGRTWVKENLTVGGTLTENSSIRYKENIEIIKYGLDKVLQLRGVTYIKKQNNQKEIGVIAEEIAEILPELVNYDSEGNPDSVSYGRITAVLIEAIKELKAEIEVLKQNK